MNRTIKLSLLALAVAASFGASAQDKFVVATGDATINKDTGLPGSTYVRMFRDILRVCPNNNLAEQNTKGSPENMDLLSNKDVDAAILQGDFLSAYDATDPARVAGIKTIVALAPEELHFIARADVKKEGGVNIPGYGNVGGQVKEFRTLADLAGRKVGAVGGSAVSGRVVNRKTKIGFQIVDVKDSDTLIKGLLDGTFDVILIVAGAPSTLVQSLDARFRILPVSKETAELLGSDYKQRAVSYAKMGQIGVPTIATQALLVSRSFRDPAQLQNLANLRKCIQDNTFKLQDMKGTHPKWQDVVATDKGTWSQYYDLPAGK